MILEVAPQIRELGLATAVLVARGLDNSRTSPELLAYRRTVGQRLASHWKNRSISEHPAIREYHRIHELFGVSAEPPAPEKLILYVRRNRDFTASGALVDCYNIVSARTLLSIGAHDLDSFEPPIALRQLSETDRFQPLGTSENQGLNAEFGYVDKHGNVICRLDVLQCEWSKVTKESRAVAFFLQTNRCIAPAVLLKGSWLLAEMISRFCGGDVELVDFLDAGLPECVDRPKPQITIDVFKHLTLQTGTVLRVAPVAGMSLSVVSVRVGTEVDALVPRSTAEQAVPGDQVIVATGLHPLTVDGRRFDAYAPAQHLPGRVSLPAVVDAIPDGKRLY